MQTTSKHLLLIIGTALACYVNVIGHQLNLDDAYVLGNLPDPGSGLAGVFSVFKNLYGHADYRPVVIFSFALEQWVMNGINLKLAHSINLALFIGIAILAYHILVLFAGKEKQAIAIIAILLFITHPVHSSVVSSIKNRDNLLSMLFGLLAWYSYLRALDGKWLLHGLAAAFFLTLALFAKLDALSFLIVIPASILIFYKQHFKKLLPVAVIVLIPFIARAMAAVYFEPAPNSVTFVENPIVIDPNLINRLLQSLQTYTYYLKFMVIPNGYWFYFGYDTLPIPSLLSFQTILYGMINLVVLLAAVWFWSREKLVSFGILFFYISLAYCGNFLLPVAGIIADRYAFIASLGYCTALAGCVCYGMNRLASNGGQTNRPEKKPVKVSKNGPAHFSFHTIKIYMIPGLICLVNSGFTIDRNKDWENTESLLRADMPGLSRSFEANRIAASVYFKKGIEETYDPLTRQENIQKGLYYALQAQSLYNGNLYINESIGQAYYNTGRPDDAVRQLRMTLRQFDTSRISMEVLGDIYFLRNQPDSALFFYNLSIKTYPSYEPVYFKYLRSLVKKNDLAGVKIFSDNLLEQFPSWYLPYQCQSFYHMEKKDSLAGLRWYKMSFEKGYTNPSDAAQVRDKLLRYGDTLNARNMEVYLHQ